MEMLIKHVAQRRLSELFVTEIVLSVFIMALRVCELIPSVHIVLSVVLYAALVLFAVINVIMLRNCFFDLCNVKVYYISNFIACAVFATINLLMCFILPNDVYLWVFAITRFLRFILPGTSPVISAIAFNAAMYLLIVLAPIGMGRLFAPDAASSIKEVESEEESVLAKR